MFSPKTAKSGSLLRKGGYFRWEKSFTRNFFFLTLPIVLQNLVSSSVSLVDNIMVGRLGTVELAAVSQANQWSTIMWIALFGLASGATVYASQFWGNKDEVGVRNVAGLSLMVALCAGLIFVLPAAFLPEQILSIFSNDPRVIELGAQYLQARALGYFFVCLTIALSATLKATGEVRIPMIASIAAVLTNITFNYLLIFGAYGFPKLGVVGAAYASNLAGFIELGLVVVLTAAKKHVLFKNFRDFRPRSLAFVKRYFALMLPVVANEALWGLGTTMYAVIYGRLGTEIVAAVSISGAVLNTMYTVEVGIEHSSAVIMGNTIGAGKDDKIKLYSGRLLLAGLASGLLMGTLLFFGRDLILQLFGAEAAIVELTRTLLLIASVQIILKSVNYVNVVGILRAGGDSLFCMCMEVGCIWLIGIPLVALGGLVLHLPFPLVYALTSVEEVVKLVFGMKRYFSMKWVHNLVEEAA